VSLLIRILIYAAVLFLVMIVYTGQQHDNARAILGDSVRKTGKFLWWTFVLVAVMELCFWLFIE
jgi:hypothetical protein